MKTGTVKFSKEFVTPIGLKEWVGIELEFDMNTEDPKEVLTIAKETVIGWYALNSIDVGFGAATTPLYPDGFSFPPTSVNTPPPVINVQRTSEDVRVAELIRDIYACTELDGNNGLWTYSKLAETNPEAKAAYEIMGKKLRKKGSQELLDATNEFYDKRRTKQSGNS